MIACMPSECIGGLSLLDDVIEWMLHDCHGRSSTCQCLRTRRFSRQGSSGADRVLSEYDEEVVGEEQDWSDFDDTSEYDDFDLLWI